MNFVRINKIGYVRRTKHWDTFVQPMLQWKRNSAFCVFPHCRINGTGFEKKILGLKSAFWFSLQLLRVCEAFLILTSIPLTMNIHRYQQIFEKPSNIKFYRNPSTDVVSCGWADTRKLIFVSRNVANAPEKHRKFLPSFLRSLGFP